MDKPLTVQRQAYPPSIRALDALVGIGDHLGLPFGKLERDSIERWASRQAGLSDFGDPGYLAPMQTILDNAEKLQFTHLARIFVRATYIKALVNRLKLVQLLKDKPEVRDVPVKRPIFVVGFPRTGTTLLQNLLAEAPGTRGLRFWELLTPLPVSDDPAEDQRRRMRAARWSLSAANLMAPEMNAVHEVRPDSYEECWYLFTTTFAVLNWDLQTGLADYGKWLLSYDMTGPYEEYKTWLQALLLHNPADQLLLKCPEHLWFLDALLEVFPDACVVWTHRDPVVSIASYCSMMTLPRRMLFGYADPLQLGRDITDRFETGVKRAMKARARHDPARFHDVDFLDLVRDPKKVVREINERFDLGHPPDMDARVQRALDAERSDERGAHVYSAAKYGIDAAAIHARYADYIEAYNIPVKKEST